MPFLGVTLQEPPNVQLSGSSWIPVLQGFYRSFQISAYLPTGYRRSLSWEGLRPTTRKAGKIRVLPWDRTLIWKRARGQRLPLRPNTANVITKDCNKGCGSYEPGALYENRYLSYHHSVLKGLMPDCIMIKANLMGVFWCTWFPVWSCVFYFLHWRTLFWEEVYGFHQITKGIHGKNLKNTKLMAYGDNIFF